jgi:salicylate 5-hydroxylase small subunit
VPQCTYRIQPRENYDRGLPLCTLAFEGHGMLKDRVYGIEQTLFHAPYYQRHVIGPPRVLNVDPAGAEASGAVRLNVEANYSVFRTKANERSELYSVGRYIDEIVRDAGALKFASKLVVFDSEMIPNSMIYPL